MRHLFRSAAVFALAVASAAVAVPALAQTASGAPKSGTAADSSTPVLDELVVTATKREESLRDIPMTVSAVTANHLQAPNLSEISIRGSGTERATGADSGVGLFVNGAYAGSSTLGGRSFKNIDFFDLERVEVLEGPQSALYGRNSEFGVVNIVLAKPKFESSGFVDETY